MYDILELNTKLLTELREIAKSVGIKRVEIMKKQDLIFRILDQQAIRAITPSTPPSPKKIKIKTAENQIMNGPVVPAFIVSEPSEAFVPDISEVEPEPELEQELEQEQELEFESAPVVKRRGRPLGWRKTKFVEDSDVVDDDDSEDKTFVAEEMRTPVAENKTPVISASVPESSKLTEKNPLSPGED